LPECYNREREAVLLRWAGLPAPTLMWSKLACRRCPLNQVVSAERAKDAGAVKQIVLLLPPVANGELFWSWERILKMRAPILRLFIAAILLLLPASFISISLDQDHNSHGSVFSNENEHLAAKVWVNTKSGKYSYPGSRWYGKTKSGLYMSEKQPALKATRWLKATRTKPRGLPCISEVKGLLEDRQGPSEPP
jgi:hypothetical protein